jgi:hypothetical protein
MAKLLKFNEEWLRACTHEYLPVRRPFDGAPPGQDLNSPECGDRQTCATFDRVLGLLGRGTNQSL